MVFYRSSIYLIIDLPMQIHEALFQGNYQHGYILKPATLLGSSQPPTSHHPNPYDSKPCRIKLDVHVISGQQLPRPKDYKPGQAVDPYVQIEMICPNGQGIENRTRAVRDNEFNPMWDERLSFDTVISSREFVFVRYKFVSAFSNRRFSLHNGDKHAASNLFASYCIRLQDLHQGTLPTLANIDKRLPTRPTCGLARREIYLLDPIRQNKVEIPRKYRNIGKTQSRKT